MQPTVRGIVSAIVGALAVFGIVVPSPAAAQPVSCDDPSCVPGINRIVELGSYCQNTMYHVFATTSWGRVVFCDSARGLPPRYFRALPVVGIREYDTPCDQALTTMAQAPDGLFLLCGPYLHSNGQGETRWIRGDHYVNPNTPNS